MFLDSKTLCHCTCPEAEKAKKALSKKALKQMIWWKAGFVHLAWNSFLPIGFMVVSQFFTYFRIFAYFFILSVLAEHSLAGSSRNFAKAWPIEYVSRLLSVILGISILNSRPFCISSIRMSTLLQALSRASF